MLIYKERCAAIYLSAVLWILSVDFYPGKKLFNSVFTAMMIAFQNDIDDCKADNLMFQSNNSVTWRFFHFKRAGNEFWNLVMRPL